MNLDNLINEAINDHNDYLRWKRKNVTIRGVRESTDKDNDGAAMLGRGLYTAFLSNKQLARQFGKVYFVLNAIPKHPKVFNTLNDWEIWSFNTMIYNYCIKNGLKPSNQSFFTHTTIEDEMQRLGYDGVIIKGREMVNFTPPNDVMYFETERQLMNYYYVVEK